MKKQVIEKLILAGDKMANILFNLSQGDSGNEKSFQESYKDWDCALRAYHREQEKKKVGKS